MYKSQPVINVLPYKEKRLLHREYWVKFFTILLNLIAVASAVAAFLLFPSYLLSQSKESLIENKLQIFNEENPNLTNSNFDKITGDINLKLETLDKAKAPYQVNEKVIDSLLSNRIEGITYSQILFGQKSVKGVVSADTSILEVHGLATNRDSLRVFKTALDNNTNFSEINLPISNFLEKSNLIFTVYITIKQ